MVKHEQPFVYTKQEIMDALYSLPEMEAAEHEVAMENAYAAGYSGPVHPLSQDRKNGDSEYIDIVPLQEYAKRHMEHSTEITVTFKQEIHENWYEVAMKEMVEKVIRRSMRRAADTSAVLLIGEHSNVGRFHFHGILHGISNDYVSKIHRALKRHIGRTQVRMVTFPDSYLKYMFKSYHTYPEEAWGYHSYIAINVDITDIHDP